MAKVAVVGAGLMGVEIAHAFASSGHTVCLIDVSSEQLAKAQTTIASILADGVRLGKVEAPAPAPAAAAALARQTGIGADRLNVNGGAIALSHPLGATGARLATSLIHELARTGQKYGLQAVCCAGGLATATVYENLKLGKSL